MGNSPSTSSLSVAEVRRHASEASCGPPIRLSAANGFPSEMKFILMRYDLLKCILVGLVCVASLSYGKGIDSTIEELKKAADGGDAYSQVILGQYYEYGIEKDESGTKFVEYYRKSAEQNHPAGMAIYGFYLMVHGKDEDEKLKGKLLHKRSGVDSFIEPLTSEDPVIDGFRAGWKIANSVAAGNGVGRAGDFGRALMLDSADKGYIVSQMLVSRIYDYEDPQLAAKYREMALTSMRHLIGKDPGPVVEDLSVDEIKALADGAKEKTLVFKDMWLGMPIEHACKVLNDRIGQPAFSVGRNDQRRKEIVSYNAVFGVPQGKYIEVLADDDGLVSSFMFSKELLDKLFDSAETPQDEFVKTFAKAYGIPEIESSMLELKSSSPAGDATYGLQRVLTHRSPKGFEITFYGEPRIQNKEGIQDAKLLGVIDYCDFGSMRLKKIGTENKRESKFD